VKRGNLPVSLFLFLVLLLSLAAVAADQFLAPALYTSSPIWALSICAVLIWRRGLTRPAAGSGEEKFEFSFLRTALFVVAHVVLVAVALRSRFVWSVGGVSATGWLFAVLKLMVLAPLLLLAPARSWGKVLRVYAPELIAAAIILFTFFPVRIFDAIWPQYVSALGRSVFWLASLFVSGLRYTGSLTPTIYGPNLDLTILPACSGLSGIELFNCLFAFIAILDWNRLRKGATALAYFAGLAVMLIGNALRIAFLIVLGNRGFTEQVARFHVSAGWLFFSAVFLVYLAIVYRSLLLKTSTQPAYS
jgi:exosortase/archaeosortase family protein